MIPWSLDEAVARARGLIVAGQRRLLGIAGPPGAGKSTITAAVCAALGADAARVPLDGFHLSNDVLAALGRADRKGAPDTFDAAGFRSLLARLRRNEDEVVYAPEFHREFEESIAAALGVPSQVPLVVVEGNYLLLDDGAWHGVPGYFDELWYVALDDAVRVQRLIDRHVAHGRTLAAATEWVLRSDEANATVVAATQARADVTITLT